MGKIIDLSRKVKLASISIEVTSTIGSTPFPIGLGKDEIILLYASKYMLSRAPALNSYDLYTILYKKTENVPTSVSYISPLGNWQTDKNVLDAWFYLGHNQRTAENIAPVDPFYQVYPKPIPLVRTPSFVHYASSTIAVSLLLWYYTTKISDKDLLELMVKDHA